MIYLKLILETIIFPGFLFTALIGLVTCWIDRKVTAKVQMRVGPPFLQPFYDIAKFMIKETCIPAGTSKMLFLSAPLIGLAAITGASVIIWNAIINPHLSFMGDLIVLMYLMTMPAMSVVLGAFASRNPIASLGGSREMKLMMAYELPLILAIIVPIIKTHSINLGKLVTEPAAVMAPSGILALIAAILCMQAKLTLVPFDQPEAETELAGGAYIEYSGPPLGIFKLNHAMLMFVLPMMLVTVFCGGINLYSGAVPIILGILKYVGLIVVVVLVRNTAPRVRIDQAVGFFWGPVTVVALFSVILALVGW